MKRIVASLATLVLLAAPAFAQVRFKDPTGDDKGPGKYVYPTDAVYKAGSFDLTELVISIDGKSASVAVSVNSNLEDPWGMGVGFAVQMIFVFIDNAGGGYGDGPPGTNVKFAKGHEWDKCIILSPQPAARVKQEVEAKASAMAAGMVVPSRTTGSGRTITARVKMADLGQGDPATWRYQVIMQSNEGFPADTDLLTRKVNEYEGQHRFGGGTDYDCDPHALDILGDHAMLKYESKPDGTAIKMATLKMISPGEARKPKVPEEVALQRVELNRLILQAGEAEKGNNEALRQKAVEGLASLRESTAAAVKINRERREQALADLNNLQATKAPKQRIEEQKRQLERLNADIEQWVQLLEDIKKTEQNLRR